MRRHFSLKYSAVLPSKNFGKFALLLGVPALFVLLLLPGPLNAQEEPSECVELGGLAWDNWTKDDSGGNGMPDGEEDSDYVRCKACHGWDHMGTDGGYVRRSRNEGRPNAGAGDGDQTSRNISFVARGGSPVTADMIFHAGTGRSFADGSGSWVDLDDPASPANKADHAAGYTLGNQHPDFSTGGANALTQEQADCLAEFLNFADGAPSAYFDAIYPEHDPVIYVIRADADVGRGETFYNDVCVDCHGDPATDHQGLNDGEPEGGILEYLTHDGKYSELASKVRWGYPDEIMSRGILGDPTSLLTADVMLYLQQLGGTGFAVNPGLSGTWWNSARSGEGFVIEFGYSNGVLTLFASYYTYLMGEQMWLTAQSTAIDGAEVTVDVFITNGGSWGDDFDPADVNLVPWGTGMFKFPGCSSGNVALMPNGDMQAIGFTDLTYDLTRDLLVSGIACPTSTDDD